MDHFDNEGLTFAVEDSGPQDAPEHAILLHGFPQTFRSWSSVTPRLTAAGIRCLAPALRGFTPGAMPAGRRPYRIERLVSDTIALLNQAGLDSAHIVGHDWGGGIAWQLAMQHPDRVRTLTAVSTPHPAALQRAVLRSGQGLKSWYMLAMQVPVLPEAVLGWGIARQGLKGLGLPAEHEQAYIDWLRRPDALRSAIAAYRALFTRRPPGAYAADTRVSRPTTYVWGSRDAYLGRAAAEATAAYCTGDYRFAELPADHWLPEKEPAALAAEILDRINPER